VAAQFGERTEAAELRRISAW